MYFFHLYFPTSHRPETTSLETRQETTNPIYFWEASRVLAFQENRFKPQAPCRLELGPHDLVVLAVGVTPELHNQVAQIQDLLSWGLLQPFPHFVGHIHLCALAEPNGNLRSQLQNGTNPGLLRSLY